MTGLIILQETIDLVHEKIVDRLLLRLPDEFFDRFVTLAEEIGMRVVQHLPLIEGVMVMREHQDRLHRVELHERDRVVLQEGPLLGHGGALLVLGDLEELGTEREGACGGVVRVVGAAFIHLLDMLEVDIDLAGTAGEGLGVGLELFHCVLDTLGRIIIVVVHVDDDGTADELVHVITLGPEGHLFGDFEVADLGDVGFLDHVADFVGAVIDDDPFDPVFRVGLVAETLKHVLDKGAAVEGGGTYRDEGELLFRGGGLFFVGTHFGSFLFYG